MAHRVHTAKPFLVSTLLAAAFGCTGTPHQSECTSLGGNGAQYCGNGGATVGGHDASGGVIETGGMSGTAGESTTGGTTALLGSTATGGMTETGGAPHTGGIVATGGMPETGGAPTIGGSAATGGVAETGGIPGSGGAPATGGSLATGGIPSTGSTAPATGGAGGSTSGGASANPQVYLINFTATDIVTSADHGFNDWSGNMGTVNKDTGVAAVYGQRALSCSIGNSCVEQFTWDFGISEDSEAYTGLFFSLFGLTDTLVTFDGGPPFSMPFDEHSLDLDRVDGVLEEPGGPRRFQAIGLAFDYSGASPLTLRVELKDADRNGRFKRFPISGGTAQTLTWDFRDSASYKVIGSADLDVHRAKQLGLIIERNNVAEGVSNPTSGTLNLHSIWFVPDRDEPAPSDPDAVRNLVERRAAQYFLDWGSRKTATIGMPQDRSTFADLLTVGGIGFALPAYVIAADRGWISHADAASRVLSVLRLMDDEAGYGAEPIGRLGYRGWLYHFLGVDGRRKLNFDFPDTAANEALNTVELSTIDTGLALMGVLICQSYFSAPTETESEIRTRAQSIYDRVDWPFMLDTAKMQFYLAWKPNEAHQGDSYEIPDSLGSGNYSGTLTRSATLDYYTDEALIDLLLAAGSTAHPIDARSAYCSLLRSANSAGLIRTYPGALFTYQFLHAFVDTRDLNFSACPGEAPVDWFANSQKAIETTMGAVSANPLALPTYGINAWGISAAEGPDDIYRAYGVPDVAIDGAPAQDGTVTYYALASSVSFGDALAQRVTAALLDEQNRRLFHYRFGLPDAFNASISPSYLQPAPGNTLLRSSGPWAQRQLFAIDEGPMLLHLENYRSGLIWQLLASNDNIQRGLRALRSQLLMVEAETGTGAGQIMPRSNASQAKTILLHDGESRALDLQVPTDANFSITVCYSNDNFNDRPNEQVQVNIDGQVAGAFVAQDTGNGGYGWNVFACNDLPMNQHIVAGAHKLTVQVSGGDGYGIEIDVLRLSSP